MDIKKLSLFIIAVGLILTSLGGVHWKIAESEVMDQANFRKEMLKARISELKAHGHGLEQLRMQYDLEAELVNEFLNDIRMAQAGFKLKVDHTISYSLMFFGMLVIFLGVGMRVSSTKKSDMEQVAK